jgi:cysteine desulfurase
MAGPIDRLYLDHNATTRQSSAVTAAMLEVCNESWGNPSSIHWSGQMARRRVETAREQVAALLSARTDEIIFMSGGSESVNAAIRSALHSQPDRRLVVTSGVEHSAVHELLDVLAGEGVETVQLAPTVAGCVDPQDLRDLLSERGSEVALVSVMWANNETGIIEPIEALADICSTFDVLMHSDATQWVGKMPIDINSLPISMLSFAGHKFHGPKGTGVLWARHGTPITPLIVGGGQEQGRRGGTENVTAIAGLGVAADEARQWIDAGGPATMPALRERFEQAVREAVPGACVNGESASRMWSTSSIGFPDLEAELLLLVMSERGLDASAGSACSSGAIKQSSVLEAMGHQPCQVDEAQYGSIRFSWDRETTWEELSQAVAIIATAVDAVRHIEPPAESLVRHS